MSSPLPQRTVRRLSRRILPFLVILYILSYIDRANVAFAKLTMTADLGFSEAVFGLGAGLFFIGYFVLEIPGALIVERWSARWWISRILVTWGACTVATGFIHTAGQFYLVRVLLGAAEAGFFPGVIVYLTHWFPAEYRARALGKFVFAIPLSLLLGAPVSGLLLGVNWFGLAGWRWVFILEGVPAIVFGVITLLYLVDRPSQARWLREDERQWLDAELAREREAKRSAGHVSIWQGLRSGRAVLLALGLFFANVGVVGFILWLPTTVQRASGLSPGAASAVSALPYACGMIALLVAGASSDRTGERLWHTVLPMFAAGVLFAATALPNLTFGALLVLLCLTGAAVYGWPPSFWVLPTLTMGESAAAAAIGLINSIGNLGGFVGPFVVGRLLTANRPFSQAVLFLSACFAMGAVMTYLAVGRGTHRAATPSPSMRAMESR